MTPAERRYWIAAQRRVADMSPELASAVLRGFQLIREQLSDAQISHMLATGGIELVMQKALTVQVLDQAFWPVRERIRQSLGEGVRYYARQIPKPRGVQSISVKFDILNPRVIDAVRSLETRVITTLQDNVRETVRAFVENGLRDGVGPRTVARDLQKIVGLSPNQERAVANFRRMLETGDRKALTKKLRDRRFDKTLRKALGKDGTGLTKEQIDKMAAAQHKRMIAHNAKTIARTTMGDSQKLAQRLAMEDAIEQGYYTREKMKKRWVAIPDSRTRDEHREMNGETVHFDEPFSNGQMIPGESEYNCRCTVRYFQDT